MLIDKPPIVAVVADLIFESKIATTAALIGVEVCVVRTPAAASGFAARGAALLVDVNVDPPACLGLIRDAKLAAPTARIIAFLSHVQVDLARQAQLAGADEVLARSEFVQRLPDILRRLA